ncbi:MAG: YjbF family lipoprotein [Sphingomonadaceae bacterium]|nr:YjbF family lipoprotein [Sphingomonadaceae bacterium]
MPTSNTTRRAFLSLASLGALAGCAGFSRSSPFWGTMAAGVDPNKTSNVTREYADTLPYASMAAWFSGSPKSLLVLAEYAPGGRLVWQSAERQAIVTDGAFVVRALGTELELRDTSFAPAVPDLRRADGVRSERWFDVAVENRRVRFGARSKFHVGSVKTVDVFGEDRRLLRVSESVSSDGKPRYSNDYWIDEADGFCWKSRQIVVPTLPPLNIEIVKRPAPQG